jgi:hypothetical protein
MAFPTINACFICELVRPETMGKFSVLGYFGVAPHVHVQIQNFALPIGLSFVFAGGPGSGHFQIVMRITSPAGANFDAPPIEGDLVAQATFTNIFMGFQGVLPGPGDYTVTLLVNGAQQFQTRLTLDQMNPPPGPARGLTPETPVRPN